MTNKFYHCRVKLLPYIILLNFPKIHQNFCTFNMYLRCIRFCVLFRSSTVHFICKFFLYKKSRAYIETAAELRIEKKMEKKEEEDIMFSCIDFAFESEHYWTPRVVTNMCVLHMSDD